MFVVAGRHHKSASDRLADGVSSWKVFALVLLLAAVYFGAAKFGFLMAYTARQVSVIWPPTGIALAAILLFGYRAWPGIALGAFLANITSQEPILVACGIALGNTLEAVAGAWLLRRFAGFDIRFGRVKDVLNFLVFAVILGTAISATIGVTSLCLGGVQPWSLYRRLWGLWWVGDATGALALAPFLLVWGGRPFIKRRPGAIAEALALVGGLLIFALAIFSDRPLLSINGHAFTYPVFLFVLWGAIRFGQAGTTVVTLLISGIAIWATIHGAGPFAGGAVETSLTMLQTFIAVLAAMGLFLGAAVSERRAMEKARALMAAVVESSADAIISLNLDGVITSWNDGAARLFGYEAGEIIGRSMAPLVPPERCGEEERVRARIRQGELIEHYETVRLAKDGRRIDVSLTVSAVRDDAGNIVGASKVARDITESRQAKRALEETDRRKDEFLSMLSHELRNPLAAVAGALAVARGADADGRRARAFSIMDNQLRQIVRLVDDLVDVSRISHGKIELHKARFMLAEAVNLARETVQPLIDEHRHHLSVDLAEEVLWLDADVTRIAQILINLLVNAAKYTPPGGRISLAAKAENGHAVIRVRDSGVGIRADLLPQIFELFKQAETSEGRAQGGLGVGLTVAKALAEMHGGAIAAYSEGAGKGSEFTVRLPLAAAPAMPADDREPQQEAPAPALRILIADDNESFVETFGYMLELAGHDVRRAHDGREALAVAQSFAPDVALIDLGLPELDGYEVCRALRALPASKHSLLVAQTGYSQPEHRARAQAAGFDHYLVKPVTIGQVEELLRAFAAARANATSGAKAA